jgi:hypothetical protein
LATRLDVEVLQHSPLHWNMMIISVPKSVFVFHVSHPFCYTWSKITSNTVLKPLNCI